MFPVNFALCCIVLSSLFHIAEEDYWDKPSTLIFLASHIRDLIFLPVICLSLMVQCNISISGGGGNLVLFMVRGRAIF